MLPLFKELGYPTSHEQLSPRFKRFLNNPGYGIAVCEWDLHIVGWVGWSRSELLVTNTMRFHIEGWVVSKEYRVLLLLI
jgi:hypothetical protein